MSLLPITLYGDKILRKKVDPVSDVNLEVIELITNMFDTMRNASGIGLAANQVGADKSIFIVDLSVVDEYKHIKPMVLINPEIISRSVKKSVMEEGCLSIPDVRAEVERAENIEIKYFDTDLKEHTTKADGLLATVMQHEYDHLQGVLFTDLVNEDLQKKLKKQLNLIKNRKVEFDYPVSEKFDYVL